MASLSLLNKPPQPIYRLDLPGPGLMQSTLTLDEVHDEAGQAL